MSTTTYEEVIQQKARRISKIEMDCTFKPVLNSNSQMICQQKISTGSNGSISDQLYNEAFERKAKIQQQEKEALNQVKSQANRTKIDVNSQKLILQKKERFLQQFLEQCTSDNQVSRNELVDMMLLLGVFQHTNQQSSTKSEQRQQNLMSIFWSVMTFEDEEQEYVSDFIVFNFLIILMETQLTTKQTKVLLTEVLNKEEDENHAPLAQEETLDQLINQFKYLLEQNKTQIEQIMAQKTSSKKQVNQEITFHPVICEKSKMIDMQSATKYGESNCSSTRYEQLFLYAKHLGEKKKVLAEISSNRLKVDPECSFKPQVNRRQTEIAEDEETHCRLYNFATKFKNHKEELKEFYQHQKEDKEMEECTFKPKTNNTQGAKQQPKVKGMEAVLERQEKARQIKYDKENYFKIKDQKLQERDLSRVTKVEPFSMNAPLSDARKVVVYVDVRISKSKKVRIALKEQDNPKQVAKNFARVHSLNSQMLTTLEEMLQGYMLQFEPE